MDRVLYLAGLAIIAAGGSIVFRAIRAITDLDFREIDNIILLLGAPIVTNGLTFIVFGIMIMGLATVVQQLKRIASK